MRVRSGCGAIAILSLALAGRNAAAQQRSIDVTKSTLTVRVYKAGLLSAFAHDHEIVAPIAGGWADTTAHRVELQADPAKLRVNDPKASEGDRAQIQKTMLGPEVLDAERYPKIEFRSTAAEPNGADSWTVRGTLTLHGQTAPVTVQVTERAGHFTGSSSFRLTAFGIKPVRIAGGAVKVKDEVRIEFDIQLAR
jgi:polyisoprenoid-binding protein YceI